MKELKHYAVKNLPNERIPDAIFYVKPDGAQSVRTYITDRNGEPIPLTISTDTIPQKPLRVDDSLEYDALANELRSNVGQVTQNFKWTAGAQEFTLVDKPSHIVYIFAISATETKIITNFITQWNVDVENKKITILEPFTEPTTISINYQFIITE